MAFLHKAAIKCSSSPLFRRGRMGEVEHWVGCDGWGWGWGIHIPAAGFEAETTLCRKVNTGTGRRGRAGQRGLSQEKNKEIETEVFPILTEI